MRIYDQESLGPWALSVGGGQGVVSVGGFDAFPAAEPGGGGIAEGADGGDEGGQGVVAIMCGLDDSDADGDEPGPPEEPGEGVAAEGGGQAVGEAGEHLPGQGPEGQERVGAGETTLGDVGGAEQLFGGLFGGAVPVADVVDEAGGDDDGASVARQAFWHTG